MAGMEKFREFVRTPWRAAVPLLAALLIATVYRAATQAISHDDAVMFEWFQSGPWSQIFGSPFGNHHPLTVLFSRIAIGIFGLSEFSQRLPSLMGAALFFYAIFRICALLTKDMMEIIRARLAAKPQSRVRVGASWQMEPGINFYRAMWQLVWMEPVFRESPDADYDYYLLLRADISLIGRRHLKLLLKDALSDSALAKAGS